MWRAALACLAIATGCGEASGGTEPSRRAQQHHMRQHLSDMRTIERMLVDGQLAEAKALAFMLDGMGDDVERAVLRLRNARTVDDAIHAHARIALGCAGCHLDAQTVPAFKLPSNAPPDRPTLVDQCVRYQWALDRVWEGLIAPSDEHWRAGIYAIATSALPRITTVHPDVAKQLQRKARSALDTATTLEARADAYAALAVTCASCHRQMATPRSDSGAASSKSTISASDTDHSSL